VATFETPLIKSRTHLSSRIECPYAPATYNEGLDLEKALLRKVGEAVGRFRMIRDGDRIAAGLSGGKDSATLLAALLLLQQRAPVRFSVCAFTIEQGKFLSPVEPVGEFFRARGVEWHYVRDEASVRLLSEQPDHGCDLCSRYRRRAVYDVAGRLAANVIALGHTADDFCEALLRNAMFTGRLSALPPVAYSRKKEFRLIRPLVYVTEELTARYTASIGAPVIPCGCSQKTGTVRRSIRDLLAEVEKDHPYVKETLLSAMGNIDAHRLLGPRVTDGPEVEGVEDPDKLFPIVTRS
jgi:tRNA 2-thiocytidine biosynthesis protein TtcA